MDSDHHQLTSRQAGFSALEMLVALGILAIVLAVIPAALHASRHAVRTVQVMDGQTMLLTSTRFIQQRLADAQPLFRSRVGNRSEIEFNGESDQMEFLAAIGESGLSGGLYRLALGSRGNGPIKSFVLSLRPYNDRENNSPLGVENRTIVHRVTNLNFRYFGQGLDGKVTGWISHWKNRKVLPSSVQIEVSVPGRSPETIEISLRSGQTPSGSSQ